MNDFFVASGRSIPVQVGEQSFAAQQLKMHNLDEWFSPALAVKTFLHKKDHSDEILTQLMAEHGVIVFRLCSLSTGLSINPLIEIAKESAAGFRELIRSVINANSSFFDEPKTRRRANTSEEFSWFNAFQLLISCGHRHDDVMRMSYGAFTEYLKAARKIQMQEHAINASVIRSAQHADKRGFEKFQKELSS